MPTRRAVLLPLLLAAACAGGDAGVGDGGLSRTHLRPRTADSTGAPFSAGVLVGNTLYLSGVLGLDSTGAIPADLATEARNALARMRGVLAEAEMTMDDLVSVQIFSPDIATYDTFNLVYREFFRGPYPARAFIGSGPLLLGARFEVQGVAVRR